MKKKFFLISGFVYGLLLISFLESYAAGFAINTQGARASGMNDAFTAKADDASAIFYNPAGINQLKGTNLSIGTTIISPNTIFNSDIGNNSEEKRLIFFPSTIYITHQINNKLSTGIGIFSPFGLGTEWPKDWEGRFIVTSSSIKTLFINPNLSWQINQDLSVSAGVDYAFTELELKKQINMELIAPGLGLPEGTVRLKGDDTGLGYNLGLLYHLGSSLNIGLTYRSPIEVKVNDGSADFSVPSAVTSFFPDSKIKAGVTLPPMVRFGISSFVLKDLNLDLDLIWTKWSDIDRLVVDFDSSLPDDITTLDWKDVLSYRFGAEYKLNNAIALRCGYTFENSPMPEGKYTPLILPDGNRNIIGLGASYNLSNNLSIDLAYQLVMIKGENKNDDVPAARGEFKTTANLLGIGIRYSF